MRQTNEPRTGISALNHVMRFLFIGLALLWAIPSQADLLWDFKDVDIRSGTINGVYAYIYPDSGGRKTPAHVAHVARVSDGPGATTGNPGARLNFVLDGTKYPSAGFGLMFPESDPLDLRKLQSIRLHLSTDKARLVRLSVAARDSGYSVAADTGVSFGCDTIVGPEGVDWVIPFDRITPPTWTEEQPPIPVLEALRNTFAIQINVSCQGKGGLCSRDTGWLFLDSLRVVMSGGGWEEPPEGKGCYGDSIAISDFKSSTPKKNGLGGWWYAFTDANALDSAARGKSKILSASDTDSASSWEPDAEGDRAYIKFELRRTSAFSGFMGLETQLGASNAHKAPTPVSIPDWSAVSFDLDYGKFPVALGGVAFHVKKAGVLFEEGLEHQIRIPYDSGSKHRCIDLRDLKQPSWSKSHQPFTPEDLLAMSWEVKLQGPAPVMQGEFSIKNVKIYRNAGVGVLAARRANSAFARRLPDGVSIERFDLAGHASATLVDARGRVLGRLEMAPGAGRGVIATTTKGLAWVRYTDARGARTIPVGF